MDCIETIKTIKNDLKRYLGGNSIPVSKLELSLKRMVEEHTISIYFDKEKLEDTLKGLGVKASDIYSVCIMTEVTGFRELMECDSKTQQSDIDRFVRNAIDETGFNRFTVLELTSDIALSANIAYDYSNDFAYNCIDTNLIKHCMKGAYVFHPSIFKDEFYELIYENFVFDLSNKPPKLELRDIELLQELSEYGITEAKFILGYYIFMSEEHSKKGVELIEDAAQEGNLPACLFLGDYYYDMGKYKDDSWGKAYKYYTGLGALGLNEQRKDAVVDILTQKNINKFILGSSILLFIETIMFFILKIGSPLYTLHPGFGVFSIMLSAAIVMVEVSYHKYYPFDSGGDIRFFTVLIFILWSIYTVIRLLF